MTIVEELVSGAEEFYGKVIESAELGDRSLYLTFVGGLKIAISDYSYICCEHRYITCDDNLLDLVGGVLQQIELVRAPGMVNTDGDEHDIMFVKVITNQHSVTLCSHNEHNGCYGGFDIAVHAVQES